MIFMAGDTTAIIGWIQQNCLRDAPSHQLSHDTPLLEQNIVDSLQIVQLVGFLESHFGIFVDVEELVPENFETVSAVVAMVERIRRSSQDP
jgi:acyl carrier protein